ncbi:hypothetical protein [Bifidobacterium choloepi]|uniref:Uncharacterized protein n=1 Tax=Bifidobacterium choloepi TaxID=2614131 RepID=A0A6I5NJE6_9BIFI|nr:hypothetical protein [Bifidobacterium choloepi]NEG70503.1 hypothetical protein [Bifidobacterium choloepi]
MQDNSGMVPKRTREEIDELAENDPSQHESKWETYKRQPKGSKWGYFYRHFFWAIVCWLLVIVAVVSFIVHLCVTPRTVELGVAFVDMSETTSQMDELEDGFLKSNSNLKSDVIQFDNGYETDSANSVEAEGETNDLNTAISADSINTLVGPEATIQHEAKEGFVEPLADALTPYQLETLESRGAVVEMDDSSGQSKPMALDLSKSAKWTESGGQSDALIGFVNASSSSYVKAFVKYLYDL